MDGIIVLLILLLFVGPKRLPMLSRSIGESLKEFRGGISSEDGSAEDTQLPTGAAESADPVDR